jgi:CRP/FNR family transcriptional regulator, cyclic AMP receptor protein
VPLTTTEKRRWLEQVPLLRGATTEVLDGLAEASGESDFSPGQPIVLQGQVGNGLYIVVAGTARIIRGDTELARLGPGDFFGELSVIDQQPRTASAYAVEPTTCLTLASWDLLAMLERDPRLALNLLKELSARLRRTDEQLRH